MNNITNKTKTIFYVITVIVLYLGLVNPISIKADALIKIPRRTSLTVSIPEVPGLKIIMTNVAGYYEFNDASFRRLDSATNTVKTDVYYVFILDSDYISFNMDIEIDYRDAEGKHTVTLAKYTRFYTRDLFYAEFSVLGGKSDVYFTILDITRHYAVSSFDLEEIKAANGIYYQADFYLADLKVDDDWPSRLGDLKELAGGSLDEDATSHAADKMPQTGEVNNSRWEYWSNSEDFDEYNETLGIEKYIELLNLSAVPVVNREVRVDEAGWAPFMTEVREEFVIPTGTVLTYPQNQNDGNTGPWTRGFIISELSYSHTVDDGLDFYTSDTNERVFRSIDTGARTYTFNEPGLYGVYAVYAPPVDFFGILHRVYIVVSVTDGETDSAIPYISSRADAVTPPPIIVTVTNPDIMTVDITVIINEQAVSLEHPPVVTGEYVFFPFEELLAGLDVTPGWDGETFTVYGEKDGNRLEIPLRDLSYVVNGVKAEVPPELLPFVYNERTYIILDYFAEAFDLSLIPGDNTARLINAAPSIPGVTMSANGFDVADGTLLSYTGPGGQVVVPEGVTEIGSRAFYGNKEITGVVLPEGVETISSSAFEACINLTEISLPSSLQNISMWAFSNCKLREVVIPYGVTEIGIAAFRANYQLTSVHIPDSVIRIRDDAFNACVSLTDVFLPESVTYLGLGSFAGIADLNIYIPDSVVGFEQNPFSTQFGTPIIYCNPGSAAHSFAVDNDFRYVLLSVDAITAANPKKTTADIGKFVSKRNSGINPVLSYGAAVPNVQTIADSRGVSVLSTENASIYEFDQQGEFIRGISLEREMDKIGAFTRDDDGNYYVFYGKNAEDGNKDQINMALVKYSPAGVKLNEFQLNSGTDDYGNGVKQPFNSSTCRLEISGDMIAVYFGKQQHMTAGGLSHQSSYGFILNINTFERLSGMSGLRMPSASHSFNQFILPVSGGFVFVDHGDANPRSFMFTKVVAGKTNEYAYGFTFKGGSSSPVHYNVTFAEMGGLAKTSSGYMFLAASEKNSVVMEDQNDARNLFIQTVDDDLSFISDPIWLTSYTDMTTQNAVHPKIVSIDNGKILILWEIFNPVKYETMTYMMVINERGDILPSAKELPGVTLSDYDTLRYNPSTGLVHWAVGAGNGIILYSLNPNDETSASYVPDFITR